MRIFEKNIRRVYGDGVIMHICKDYEKFYKLIAYFHRAKGLLPSLVPLEELYIGVQIFTSDIYIEVGLLLAIPYGLLSDAFVSCNGEDLH